MQAEVLNFKALSINEHSYKPKVNKELSRYLLSGIFIVCFSRTDIIDYNKLVQISYTMMPIPVACKEHQRRGMHKE